jgi:hypothetical protein
MGLLRATVTLQHDSGLPEDVSTNTFYFSTAATPPDITDVDAITEALEDFYCVTPAGGAAALYTYFSAETAQNGHTVTVYDMDDPEPRAPIDTHTFNLPANPTGDPLPGEVALCLSFQAATQSGQPQARRRGRVYIGRLDTQSMSSGRPDTALQQDVALAGQALLDLSDTEADWSWVVYSPTLAAAGDPTPYNVVTNGWCDNAYDTQRRRGLLPTSRTTFS